MPNKSPNEKNPKPPQRNAFLKYTGIATRMAVIIVGGTMGGRYLDKYLQNDFPIFTLILTLASVGFAMYLTIRDIAR